jgi:HlyD family secretion protein
MTESTIIQTTVKKKKSKLIWWIVGALVLIVILMIVFGKKEDGGLKVTVETTAVRTITETVNASGKIFPEVEVKVSPDISGEVVELNISEGDTVRRGQVLARIYADIYASQRDQASAGVAQMQAQTANARASLNALKANLDQAQNNYDRQKQLLDQRVISRAEFEQSEQAYLSAKANYEAAVQGIRANEASVRSAMASLSRANKDVNRATIIAPMDGVVSLLAVKKGERVVGTAQMAGTEMLRIADLKSIEVQVDVGENDIPKVKFGDTALVEVDAYNNRKFKGTVYKIANPVTSMASGASTGNEVTNYKVHIRLIYDSYKDLIGSGKPFPFRPNMNASADIQTRTVGNVIAVPLNAVTTRDKKTDKAPDRKKTEKKDVDEEMETNDNPAERATGDETEEVVFVLQADGSVKKRVVTTGVQDLNYIQITTGLKKGEKIVTGPYNVVTKTLKEGTKVKETKKEDLYEGDKE